MEGGDVTGVPGSLQPTDLVSASPSLRGGGQGQGGQPEAAGRARWAGAGSPRQQ